MSSVIYTGLEQSLATLQYSHHTSFSVQSNIIDFHFNNELLEQLLDIIKSMYIVKLLYNLVRPLDYIITHHIFEYNGKVLIYSEDYLP